MERFLLVACILAVYLVFRFYWQRRRRKADRPPDSIVLLLAKHAPMNPQYLSIVVSRALGREVPRVEGADDSGPADAKLDVPAGDCVMGQAPHFMMYLDGGVFLLHSMPAPYVDPAEFEETFRGQPARAAIEAHTAWLSVDFLGQQPNAASDRTMGKIAAEFVGPDCLAIYHPPTEKIVPVAPESLAEFQEKLRSEAPIAALFGADGEISAPPVSVEDTRL